MSRFEDGSYGSLSGVALIAKVLAGRCGMKYTRAAAGKGAIPENMTPKTMTGCAEYVMDAKIAAVTNPVDGECQVTVQIKSDEVESGFYLTNIVLFAEDPDKGEVPYTYLSLENEPEWIRPASSIVGKLATFDLIAAVGDIDAVSANIDPDAITTYATVKQMIANATAVFEITIPKDGWTDGGGVEEPEPWDDCGLHVDIPVSGMTEAMQPFLGIHHAHLETANDCGMSTTARSMEGALRLYAKSAPVADMTATLTLLCATSDAIGGWVTTASLLPIATTTHLGCVRIPEGSGLVVDGEGNIAIDAAADQDAEGIYNGSEADFGQG